MVPKYFFISLLLFTGLAGIKAQDKPWDIPADAKAKTAPFLFTDSVKKAGEAVYIANCKSCHGDPGKNNHAILDPIPKDPATAEYQAHTDGEMFYILGVGRGLMPSFQTSLTDEQRWQVISYVRSFNKDYVQPAIKLIAEADVAGTIKMTLSYDEKYKQIIALLLDRAKEKPVPVNNIPVKLFIKRTFGNLPVGAATTNAEGKAYIKLPDNLPGDTAGYLGLIAVAGAGGKQLEAEISERAGIAVKPALLLDQRSWWNVRSKAPLWLIISYALGGIAVGSSVLYVIMQLKKIRDINKVKMNSHE